MTHSTEHKPKNLIKIPKIHINKKFLLKHPNTMPIKKIDITKEIGK